MHTVFTKNRSQPVLDWFFSPGLKGWTETVWTWQLPKLATMVQLHMELVWSSRGLLLVTQLDFQTLARRGVMSGDTPSHTSAVPDSTSPLGQNSTLLRFLSWNSAPLPFLNSAPLSLPELLWMWNSLHMYTQSRLEVCVVQGQCALSNDPKRSQVLRFSYWVTRS